ncbi:hypothetical protein STEG23_030688 [Scotinomys teguina]
MEVVAAAPRCQLLLILLVTEMLLLRMKGSPLLVRRKIARIIELQESIGKEDEKLWIASRLIWFDQPRPPDSSSDVPKSRSASRQLLKDEASQTAPVKIGPSS